MADESSGQEKTEAPTQRRLQEAREKGDVAKSTEVPSAAVLLAGLLTLYIMSNYMLERFYAIFRHYLGNLHAIEIIPANMLLITRDGMELTAMAVVPLMAVIIVVAIGANFAQVGILFATEKITPNFGKVNPIKGFSNLFSKQTLAQSVKSIAKLLIIGYVAYFEILSSLPGILPLMDQQPIQILSFMARIAFWIFLKSALIICILAAADYAFQRWQFLKKMKMTKQEVKEEAKQTEGDPLVRGRIRSIQREMARRRMMAEVPKADVVITNPTHIAIAMRYDNMTMEAPTVIAKGAGIIAHRIKTIADEHGIPMVEDKPLARLLFKSVEINATIPENLYQAVAQVLAYVYSLKQKTG
jgi:flagellar biosynthetic protein FlhB